LLLRRLDGRLDEGEQGLLDDHLAACPGCREAAAAQKQVADALASRPEAAVGPGFAERLSQRLTQQSAWFALADWKWLSVRLAPITALLLLAAGVVVERESSQAAQSVSLSSAMETVATGAGDRVPVTSIVWQPDVNTESLVVTVLAAPADATIGETGR
jgi:anti-sigma factor RsiW